MPGVSLTFKVDDVKVLDRLGRLAARGGDRALTRILGEIMRDSIEQTFAEEGSPAGSWRRLHASSLGVEYSKMGKKKGKKAFTLAGLNTAGFLRFATQKKILQGSGLLKNSISYRPASSLDGQTQLLIGSNLIYARIHQLGGVIRAKSAKALRFPIATPMGIQWISKRSVTMPARPFLVFRPDDPRKLGEAVQDFVMQ